MLGSRGFTLIELLVTMAVLGIISAMAVPSFVKIIAKQRLSSNTQELVTTLVRARSQALLVRQSTTVNLNNSTLDNGLIFNWQADGVVLKSTTLNPIFFTNNGFAAKEIDNPSFDSTQPVSTTNPKKIKQVTSAIIILCNVKASETRTINILLNGSIEKIVKSPLVGTCS